MVKPEDGCTLFPIACDLRACRQRDFDGMLKVASSRLQDLENRTMQLRLICNDGFYEAAPPAFCHTQSFALGQLEGRLWLASYTFLGFRPLWVSRHRLSKALVGSH